MTYVVTNNGLQAKRDFPNSEIVETFEAACCLPKESQVIVCRYAAGAARRDACSAAEALIRVGLYNEVEA